MSEYDMGVIGLVLGVIGILAGIATSYYFYLKTREVVDPRYALTCSQLLPESSEMAERLKFFYDGVEVSNLNVCSVMMWNRGRRTIEGTDIASADPLRVELPGECRAISAKVDASRSAIALTATINEDGSRVLIAFDFLDRADAGSVDILYQGDSSQRPLLLGTLRGAPRGFRLPPYGISFGDPEEATDDEDDKDDDSERPRRWVGVVIPGVVLALLAAGGVLIAGWANPVTVVILTLLTLWVLLIGGLALIGRILGLVMQRSIGLPESFRGSD